MDMRFEIDPFNLRIESDSPTVMEFRGNNIHVLIRVRAGVAILYLTWRFSAARNNVSKLKSKSSLCPEGFVEYVHTKIFNRGNILWKDISFTGWYGWCT